MLYILFVILLFIASVAVHISFCRKTTSPGLQAKVFVITAIIFFGIYVACVWVIQYSHWLDPHSLWGLPFRITAGLVFILLVPVYLSFYVLTQLMSPSKKILMCISRQGSLSYADILASIEQEEFINTRLRDLVSSGCVKKVEDRYLLSSSGQKIAAVLNIMQHILGRGIGG